MDDESRVVSATREIAASAQELAAYEQEFTNHGYGAMPLWLTEFGWPGNAHATDNYHPSFSAQASDRASSIRPSRARQIARLKTAPAVSGGMPILAASSYAVSQSCQRVEDELMV